MESLLTLLQEVLPELLQGTLVTLQLTVVALAIGLAVGLPAALVRVYGGRVPRWLAVAYIEIFRGTPLVVQLFVVYYGLPDLGITFSRMAAAFVTLGLNSGAYQAEYFRGAIQAVGSGQMTAARALGMTQWQAIRYIILPQAIKLALPAWSNEAISMIKYTAVVFLIAVPDLMGKAKILGGRNFNYIELYIIAAVIYILLVFIATRLVRTIERKLYTPGLEMEAERH
jgi:polar amino acid transport system permease protein